MAGRKRCTGTLCREGCPVRSCAERAWEPASGSCTTANPARPGGRWSCACSERRCPCRCSQPRPSGPPPAAQRRTSSVVIRGGREVCDHAARTPAASWRAGRDAPGRCRRGLPGSQLCGARHLTGGSFLHNSEPGTPRWALVLRVLGAPLPLPLSSAPALWSASCGPASPEQPLSGHKVGGTSGWYEI